jgi:hypothetical protein
MTQRERDQLEARTEHFLRSEHPLPLDRGVRLLEAGIILEDTSACEACDDCCECGGEG